MTTFSGTEIIDNGASLRIVADGGARLILKRHIHEISVLKSSVLKLDVGDSPLRNIYIEHSEVTNPRTNNAEELRTVLNEMLKDCITEIHQELNQIAISVEAINSEISIEALIVHQVRPDTSYRGYALPGTNTSDTAWAIQKVSDNKGTLVHQWADGNRNFDNVWDDRENLQYS